MTIQGALANLNNLLKADDVPFYYKGSIKKIIETIEMEFEDKVKDLYTSEEIAKSFIEDVEAVKDQLPKPRDICCGDDRFKIIAMAKEDILKSTNIEDSPEEMAVLDNILFRCWQMGWLDGYRVKGDKI